MKYRVIILALALCLLCAAGLAETSGDWTYTVEDGAATITRYKGTAAVLTIPRTLDGYPVTAVGKEAFIANETLTELTIPDGIKTIANRAFSGCTSMTRMIMGRDVVSIGDYAFSRTGLTSAAIPQGLRSIGKNPFLECSSLTAIHVPLDCPNFREIDGILFRKTDNTLVSYPIGITASSYEIPRGIRTIGSEAFYNCANLTSVTIPDTVNVIEYEAFSGTGLREITIPVSVRTLGSGLFFRCMSLTSFTFHGCPEEMDGSLFERCDALTEVTIPESFTTVPRFMFSHCAGLRKVNLPEGLTAIDNGAFSDCTALTDIVLPASLQRLGDSVFCGCTTLKTLDIPDGVTEFGERIFNVNGVFADSYEPLPGITVNVTLNSPAMRYCIENNVSCAYEGMYDWLLD